MKMKKTNNEKAFDFARNTKRLQRAFAFWCWVSNHITRFSLHGFVQWRIREIVKQATVHNKRVMQFNRERARVRRIERKGNR